MKIYYIKYIVLLFFLSYFGATKAQGTLEIEVFWEFWSSENRVTLRDNLGNTINPTICDPTNCFNGAANSFNSTVGTPETYSVPFGANFSLLLEDTFGDGWNGAKSYVRVAFEGGEILQVFPGNFGRSTIINFSTPNQFVAPLSATVNESIGNATIGLQYNGPITTAFTVDYTTIDGTAFAGSDYTSTSGNVLFTGIPGQIVTIAIPIVDNTFLESDEIFQIQLSNSSNASVEVLNGQVVIQDDADTPVPNDVPLTLFDEFNGYFDYTITGDSFRNSVADPCSIVNTRPAVGLSSPILPGATIERAFLYWGHSGDNADNVVTFEGQTVVADIVNSANNGAATFFGMLSDVTSIIQSIPNPSTNLYDVTDLTIENAGIYCGPTLVFGGWNLVIIYEEDTLPAVSINIYNGFDGGSNNSSNFILDGFFAIGASGSKTSVMSWEGDQGLANNESLEVTTGLGNNAILSGDGDNNGTTVNNPFNSTFYDDTIAPVVDRETLGQDFDTYDISALIQQGESSVTTTVNVGQDFIIANAVLLKVPSNLMVGRVFEDINYGGGAGRNRTVSSGISIPNVTIELYREDTPGNFILEETTVSDSTGEYVLGGMENGNYKLRVVNNTVRSTRGGGNTCTTCIPVQTFRKDYLGSGTFNDVNNEVGGANPFQEDTGLGILADAQTVSDIVINSEGVLDMDFGFNFNTIVNTNSSGQGSLGQFIENANQLDGATLDIEANSIFDPLATQETSIFMIPPTGDSLGRTADANFTAGGYFDIEVLDGEDLPIIFTNNIQIDGRTQRAYSGNNNTGIVGASRNSVGRLGLRLPNYPRPEIQVHQNNGNVFQLQGDDLLIRELAVFSNDNAGIVVSAGNSVIQHNFIGVNAEGLLEDNTDVGISILGSALSIIQNNFISKNIEQGIFVDGTSSPNIIRNHITENGVGSCFDNIRIAGGTNVRIINNIIEKAAALGIDAESSIGDIDIIGNTIRQNGQDGTICNGILEDGGIYLQGNNSTIQDNIINHNGGAGIVVNGGANSGNLISQNSFYANGTNRDALGIDLANDAIRSQGDGVTLSDIGDTDTGPNTLQNFPSIEAATIKGSTLRVSGWSRPGAIIEFYLTDINQGVASAGDNSLGLSTDYGEGQLFLGVVTEGSGLDNDTTVSTYNDADGNTDNTNRFSFDITLSSNIPLVGNLVTATATIGNSTSEFSNFRVLRPQTIITNRRITYRVSKREILQGITGELTNRLTANDFQDGNNSSNFRIQIRNVTNTAINNYQVLVRNVPYATIPSLVLGNHTLSTFANGNSTFNHVFTSTSAIPANGIVEITGNDPSPIGVGISCGCVTFYEP